MANGPAVEVLPSDPFRRVTHLTDQDWRSLYRFVYAKVQNREEAEDVTQEACLRFFRAKPELAPEALPGYLRVIAVNLMRDRWRRSAKAPVTVGSADADGTDLAEMVAAKDAVRKALGQISDEHRQVLELRIVGGLSTEETARRMNRSEVAVRSLQYRAVLALREAMR